MTFPYDPCHLCGEPVFTDPKVDIMECTCSAGYGQPAAEHTCDAARPGLLLPADEAGEFWDARKKKGIFCHAQCGIDMGLEMA